MPKKRSRAGFSWKQEIGGVPVWGIGVAAVAILGMLAVPAVVSATTPTAAPYVRPTDAFDEPEPATPAPRIAFLGDSYTGGSSMGGTEGTGWPALTADHFGLAFNPKDKTQFLPQGGTGFLRHGAETGPFIERVPALIEGAPDIVVIAGGINDGGLFAPEEIRAAAFDVFTAVRSGLPDAQIVVVGPFYPQPEQPAEYDATRDAIFQAAADAGITTVVDPLPWFDDGSIEIGEDGTHPTDAGHAVLAQRMIEAMTPVVQAYYDTHTND